jgi:membrane fusion protein (multidrug efflux system)
MSSSSLRWFGIVLLLAAMVGVGAWTMRAQEALRQWDPVVARTANQPIPVRTVKVDKKDIEETIGGTAVTMPARIATITIPQSSSSAVDRRVKAVNFWPGSSVKQGATILDFEPQLYQQAVRQEDATVKQAKMEVDTTQKLFNQKAASGLQLETAKVLLETAQLKLDLAKRDLALCVIPSPIPGVIEQLNVVPQMEVTPGLTLAVVTQLDPIYVTMDYPMERLDSLRLDAKADVVLDAFPQDIFHGKVIRVLPVVQTKARVVPVTIEVANPGNRIKAGIAGFVRVKGTKSNVTAIPTVAVIKNKDDQKSMVVCVEKGRAKVRQVRTGAVVREGEIEVLDGLNVGDDVVVYGQKDVEENDLVNADWHKWTHRSDLDVAAQ